MAEDLMWRADYPLGGDVQQRCLAILTPAVERHGAAMYARLGLEEHGADVAANLEALYEAFLTERLKGRHPLFLGADFTDRVNTDFEATLTSDIEIAVRGFGDEPQGPDSGAKPRRRSYGNEGEGGGKTRRR